MFSVNKKATKPTGPTDENLKKLIIAFEKQKNEQGRKIAKMLAKPRRKKKAVALSQIEGNIAAYNVVATGEMKKPSNVYAWKFSKGAKEKIEKAGGKCLDIEELLKEKKEVTVL